MVNLSPDVLISILLYSLSSSSLLLINKLCLHLVPAPSLISLMQFLSCTVYILLLKASGMSLVDGFEWAKAKPYLIYTVMFTTTIYCNMKALQAANVETLIVFRSCCPLLVAILDWGFLGRQLPSLRSFMALLLLTGGVAGYVLSDKAFSLQGWNAYTWVSAYFVIISIEMAYAKHIVGPHLGFKSMWGPALYTNSFATLPMLFIALATHEPAKLTRAQLTAPTVALVTLSCIVGIAISFTGWSCRSKVTATCFTVIGVANKMLTVLVNLLIWDYHASPIGILCLTICLLGATLYQQAPLRDDSSGVGVSGDSSSKGVAKQTSQYSWSFGVALLLMLLGGGVLGRQLLSRLLPRGTDQHSASESEMQTTLHNLISSVQNPRICNKSDDSSWIAWAPPVEGANSEVASQLQSYVRTFSSALAIQRVFLGAMYTGRCSTSAPPKLTCYLVPVGTSCLPLRGMARHAVRKGPAQASFDLSFVNRMPLLQTASQAWVIAQLTAIAAQPTPWFAEHIAAIESQLFVRPPDVLGGIPRGTIAIQLALGSVEQRTDSMRHQKILEQLASYTGSQYVLLAASSTRVPHKTAGMSDRQLAEALVQLCTEERAKLSAAMLRARLSVTISCVPLVAALRSGSVNEFIHVANSTSGAHAWDSKLYLLTAIMLLARADVFVGDLAQDFGRTVHELMMARLGKSAVAGSPVHRENRVMMPYAFDVANQYQF
mmetsp:Transcript_27594/g.45929  ORF Transcript_27594/g.45929 Transcript_27594/m.45929 type:complete len:717 (+) Transcript_27594:77-2227(+)